MSTSEVQQSGNDFFTNGVRIVKLTDWMDWAICAETSQEKWAIVLPMIQRGSVWKPHQVIDLWDTILRGMPFGGLMASLIPADTNIQFFHPLDRSKSIRLTKGGLSLIDGQQRTLAMLIAWPDVSDQMQRRIWVDFGEDDTYDHVLRLHFTSESSPMGYQRAGPSGQVIARLSLNERRLANATYADRMQSASAQKTANKVKLRYLHDEEIAPWHSTFALDLRTLLVYRGNTDELRKYVHEQAHLVKQKLEHRITQIQSKQAPFDTYNDDLKNAILKHLNKRFDFIKQLKDDDPKTDDPNLERRIRTLADGLALMAQQHFPVIEVPERLMEAKEADERKDPPLAVLFKRIGTGGTDLKTADYVFSVLKHLNPECHNLVEQQFSNPAIAALYSPTNLVMSAVRLTAAKLKKEDQAKLDKSQFTRLLRGDKADSSQDSKQSAFYIEFNEQIKVGGEFVENLNEVLNLVAYLPSNEGYSNTAAPDIGLPLHALSLIQIPALEVILYWIQESQISISSDLPNNRHAFVRFLLCWHLTVLDAIKATRECFKLLANKTFTQFPEAFLFKALIANGLALPICRPQILLQQQVLPIRTTRDDKSGSCAELVYSSKTVSGLRGWRRFEVSGEIAQNDPQRQAVQLYRRWWNLRGGHIHPMLLWLQRDYIFKNFQQIPAQPGTEDDTPYDFDHICPYSHWGDWTGKKTDKTRLLDFHAENFDGGDKEGHWRLGNAIGNLRVWDSSVNRSDGDTAPAVKLKLDDVNDTRKVDSVITYETIGELRDETQAWRDCGPLSNKDYKEWSHGRACAFQTAIELRTFNLYQRFYVDLRFDELTDEIASVRNNNEIQNELKNVSAG